MTATTEVVISEKSKLELLMSDFSGTAHSRMSTIRMGFISIPVRVRPQARRLRRRVPQEPTGGKRREYVDSSRAHVGRPSVSRTRGGDHGRQRPFRGSP